MSTEFNPINHIKDLIKQMGDIEYEIKQLVTRKEYVEEDLLQLLRPTPTKKSDCPFSNTFGIAELQTMKRVELRQLSHILGMSAQQASEAKSSEMIENIYANQNKKPRRPKTAKKAKRRK